MLDRQVDGEIKTKYPNKNKNSSHYLLDQLGYWPQTKIDVRTGRDATAEDI